MANYHLSVKAHSRSAGRSAVAAAAYRAGAELVDRRTGVVHDYTQKRGVLSTDLVLPEGAPEYDRASLWNAAEQAEKRKNSTVAREIILALPEELDAGQRRELALAFAREFVARHGCAADVAMHAPDKKGDSRNWHAHILTSTRRVTPEGMGEKCRELDSKQTGPALVSEWRERWGELQNRALELAGSDERVDHRSYAAQGVELLPTRHMGPVASAMERRGERTEKGDANRAAREHNAAIIELAELRHRRDRMLEDRARFAAIVAENEEQPHQPDPAQIAQDNLITEQAAAEQRRADEARAQREREAKMAALAAAAQARLAEQAAQRKAAEEAERKAQEQAAAANRDRIAAGGWQPRAMTDHLIDYPNDRANLLAAYLDKPDRWAGHTGTAPGRLKDEIRKTDHGMTELKREAVDVAQRRQALQGELKQEQQRPLFSRLYRNRIKPLQQELAELNRRFRHLKTEHGELEQRHKAATEALPAAERKWKDQVQANRRAEFEQVESAVPERRKEREQAEQLRQKQQEAPRRRQSHTRRGPGQSHGPKMGR